MYLFKHFAGFSYSNFVKVIYRCIRNNLCRPICFAKYWLIKNDIHAFCGQLYKRIFNSLPCFVMSVNRQFGTMLGNMDYPNLLVSVIGNKLFNIKTFCRKIDTAFR